MTFVSVIDPTFPYGVEERVPCGKKSFVNFIVALFDIVLKLNIYIKKGRRLDPPFDFYLSVAFNYVAKVVNAAEIDVTFLHPDLSASLIKNAIRLLTLSVIISSAN